MIESRNPGSQSSANASSHRRGSVESAQPPTRPNGVYSASSEQDVTARGSDRRVDQCRHVDQQSRAIEDPAVGHHRRPTVDVCEARCDRRRRPERPVEAAQHRGCRQHGVDLRFVALVVAHVAPTPDQVGGRVRRMLQPSQERVVRVAGRHHDRRGDLGAVGQGDAAHALAAAHDRVDRALRAQRAIGRHERGEQRGRHLAAAADRPADRGRRDASHASGRRVRCRASRG